MIQHELGNMGGMQATTNTSGLYIDIFQLYMPVGFDPGLHTLFGNSLFSNDKRGSAKVRVLTRFGMRLSFETVL